MLSKSISRAEQKRNSLPQKKEEKKKEEEREEDVRPLKGMPNLVYLRATHCFSTFTPSAVDVTYE